MVGGERALGGTLFGLFVAGALLVMCFSLTTSLAQLLAPAELRGRVVSIYMVAFRGGSPLGGLVAGWLVTLVGSAPTVLAINGGLLTITQLTREDYAVTGADESYSEGVVDHLRSLEGTAVAGLVRDLLSDAGSSRKVSLRATDDRIDVSRIARAAS